MKKKDLIKLYTTLHQLSGIKSTKFAYFVMKNIKKIEPEIELIKELSKSSPEFLNYDSKRIVLNKKYCNKNEDGRDVIENGIYLIEDSKREEYSKEMKDLLVEYKDAIEERGNQEVELSKLLEEENDVDFYKIRLCDLPELDAKILSSLDELIKEY